LIRSFPVTPLGGAGKAFSIDWEGIYMKRKSKSHSLAIFLFLLPALILFVGLLIAPIIMSLYYSFFDWNGLKALNPSEDFLGFGNYTILFGERIQFGKALINSLILAGLSVFVQLPVSLALALALGKKIKGERVFLSIYFMPVLISTVVIGQLWLKIYNPEYGILNTFLRAIGVLEGDIRWLGEKNLALGAVFAPTLWQYVGYHMLLLYAGVKSVSPELREAAKLDGATDGQVNRFVVIPSIKPIIKVSVIFAVTGSLKSFDLIYVLTNGGPMKATEVPSIIMIRELFLKNKYGVGSAIAVLLILLCFFFAILIGAIFKERDIYGKK
jgi:raffinose/stachyose/melibiose transport system permease protein